MHSVALMVYPGFQSLSLSVSSVFECANLLRDEPAYEFHLVSQNGGPVMSSQGFSVNSTTVRAEGYDTLMVSGYLDFRLPEAELLDLVRAASAQSRRVAPLAS